MFEFIGIFAAVYFFIIGISRLFIGNRPKREYYIIREFEIDDKMEQELEALLDKQAERRTIQTEKLPDNVVSIKRRRREDTD